MVTGRVKANVWTPTEGEHAGVEQRRLDVIVEEIGLSLRFHPAKANRTQRATAETEPSRRRPATRRSETSRVAGGGEAAGHPGVNPLPTAALTPPRQPSRRSRTHASHRPRPAGRHDPTRPARRPVAGSN